MRTEQRLPGIRKRGRMTLQKNSTREIGGVRKLFCNLTVVVVTCISTCADTYNAVHQEKTGQFHCVTT